MRGYRIAAIGLAAWTAISAPLPARAADRVIFGTDWKAQAEQGGFYQALATGIYAKYRLDVSIQSGGPQVNQAQLLAAGRLDFNLASNSFIALNYVAENVPMVAIAAIFQKDPAVLIAHPGQGIDSPAALKGKPIMIGADTRIGYWQFLKLKFAFADNQIRPYTFSIAPFLADRSSAQQGYLGSEPFLIEKQGIEPVVLLLADSGYRSYGAVVETSTKLATARPDLAQRFVDASIEGWYSYLFGDPSPGNALIKANNPEMTDDLLAYGIAAMKRHGIVGSGDAVRYGIGAMNEGRWREFFETMSQAGVYPADLDWRRAFSLRFVNKGVGLKESRKAGEKPR